MNTYKIRYRKRHFNYTDEPLDKDLLADLKLKFESCPHFEVTIVAADEKSALEYFAENLPKKARKDEFAFKIGDDFYIRTYHDVGWTTYDTIRKLEEK